jgi:hypothetical protein
LINQFTRSVTTSPAGFHPTSLKEAKSTFILIGMEIEPILQITCRDKIHLHHHRHDH